MDNHKIKFEKETSVTAGTTNIVWKAKPPKLGGGNPIITSSGKVPVNVKVDDEITFSAPGAPDESAVRIFITTDIFGGWGSTTCIKIKKGKAKSKRVKKKASGKEVYYSVLLTDLNKWAEGESYPSIIID